jgi:hypothetical protein
VFDVDLMDSESSNEEMIRRIFSTFLERAKTAPEFVRDAIGLINEAVKRNAI